jgi:hypothetical protein
MHASLVRPLGEGGKLKLTSDMTELEFAISQLLGSSPSPRPAMLDLGNHFTALRSFRSLLFKDSFELTLPELLPRSSGLNPELVAQHIIIRSESILLPHELHKWSRIEYLKWLESHPDTRDAMQLIQGSFENCKAQERESNRDDIWLRALGEWMKVVQSSDGVLSSTE